MHLRCGHRIMPVIHRNWKSVQHVFLRYLLWKSVFPMDWRDHNFLRIMSQFKIPTLESVRLSFDAQLAFNIINRNVNCPDLSNLFVTHNIYCNLRHPRMFNEGTHRLDIVFYSTIPRIIRLRHNLPPRITEQDRFGIIKHLSNTHLVKYAWP